jgi:hypothetical protein
MRLGFDLDGTLADLQGTLAREAGRLFPDIDPANLPRSANPDEPSAPPEAEPALDNGAATQPTHRLTSRQQRELWAAVRSSTNFWEPGAVARLATLARERRWEIIFLTSRPETRGDTAQLQTHRWLAAHGFPWPSVFVVHGSRGKIASALALDVIVDDRPENCLDVAIDSSARAVLVWRGDEDTVPASARQLGIGAVKSIGECLDILEQLDTAETERTGMVDRLKRLLGLKPRAARLRETSRAETGDDAVSVKTAIADR